MYFLVDFNNDIICIFISFSLFLGEILDSGRISLPKKDSKIKCTIITSMKMNFDYPTHDSDELRNGISSMIDKHNFSLNMKTRQSDCGSSAQAAESITNTASGG